MREIECDDNMIDIHCHLLPGIDDGAKDLEMSVQMARMAATDGISVIACTPHILPGIYNNSGPEIRQATENLQLHLDEKNIPVRLVDGAENHIVHDFIPALRSGKLLTIANSRYVLVETPLQVAPPRLEDLMFEIILEGYVPILAHPERLSWIKTHYTAIHKLAQRGVWMQITASSITGHFGRRNLYWAERMMDDGIVHIIATDAHNTKRRPPNLSAGHLAAIKWVGEEEAEHMVVTRPQGIIENELPSNLPLPASIRSTSDQVDESATSRTGQNGQHQHTRRHAEPRGLHKLSHRLRRLFQ